MKEIKGNVLDWIWESSINVNGSLPFIRFPTCLALLCFSPSPVPRLCSFFRAPAAPLCKCVRVCMCVHRAYPQQPFVGKRQLGLYLQHKAVCVRVHFEGDAAGGVVCLLSGVCVCDRHRRCPLNTKAYLRHWNASDWS